MSDIVERLRDTPNWQRQQYGEWKGALCVYDRAPFEAADEIERLRALLETANLYGAGENASRIAAEAEAERLMVAIEADAWRYRWIKDVALTFNNGRVEVLEFIAPVAYGENIDAAIDAALKEQKK